MIGTMHRPDHATGGTGRATAHAWLRRLTRAFGASLLLLLLGGAGVVAAADVGHQDFAATGEAITGSKPESKLWYNDGIWWASMWSTSPAGYFIYRLNPGDGRLDPDDDGPRPSSRISRRHPVGRHAPVCRLATVGG